MAPDTKEAVFSLAERFVLDPDSPVPLYYQMEEIVRDRISDNSAIGRMLPSEKDLMRIFGVSRATVKKTLDNLSNEGMIERRRALGTRVVRQEITENLGRLSSYTEEMESRGLTVKTEVLDVLRHEPDEYVREKLGLAEGDEIISIRRLRGTTKVFPVVLLQSELPASLGISLEEDFSGSLYRLLEKKYRVQIKWAEESIRAGRATSEQAQRLDIAPKDCVLIMERQTFGVQNRPVEFVRAVYRSDHYRFSIRLKR